MLKNFRMNLLKRQKEKAHVDKKLLSSYNIHTFEDEFVTES